MFPIFAQDTSLKNRTLKHIYQTVHQYGPLTKADIIKKTKLTQTTATRFIDVLLQNNFIGQYGIGESCGGRKPVLYHIQPESAYIVGIDISRRETQVFLLNLLFEPLEKNTFLMTKRHTPEETIAEIQKNIEEMLEKRHINIVQILGIGIGAVGPLDRGQGLILNPENFPAPGWDKVAIVNELQKTFPVKILLENGANTAALAEYTKASLPFGNILYCICGVGLRCGVIANGGLVQSKTGEASSYGHMIIDTAGRECSCGNKGCLTAYISFPAIIHEAISLIENGRLSILSDLTEGDLTKIDTDLLFTAMEYDDPLTLEVVINSARFFGIGLANMINLLHPEVVILNSRLIYKIPEYYEEATATAFAYIYQAEKSRVRFMKGTLESAATPIGAAILIFQHYFGESTNS